MSALSSAAAPADRETHWAWEPPGIIFHCATALAVLAAFDANSRGAFLMAASTQMAWFLLAGIWLVRFVGAASTKRLRLPVLHWIRWMAVPLVLGVAFLLTQTSVPSDVRFSVSRGAMNQAAAEVMAGGSTNRSWIGLYPAERVERIANGMRFIVAGSGFIDQVGFAYSTDAHPAGTDGIDKYEPLGDGWWTWVERFE